MSAQVYVSKRSAGSLKEARKAASQIPGYTKTKRYTETRGAYKFPQTNRKSTTGAKSK